MKLRTPLYFCIKNLPKTIVIKLFHFFMLKNIQTYVKRNLKFEKIMYCTPFFIGLLFLKIVAKAVLFNDYSEAGVYLVSLGSETLKVVVR